MSTHTPGPWEIESGHIQNGGIAYWQITDGADAICCNQFCYADNSDANARLIAAAPDLLHAQTMGSSLNTPDFLDFVADRLVNVYGESPNVDFVLSLRARAQAGRDAIAKAKNS